MNERIAAGSWRWKDALMLAFIVATSVFLAMRCAGSMSLTIDERGQTFLGEVLRRPGGLETLTSWGTAPLPVLATATLPAIVTPAKAGPPIDDVAFLFRRRMFNLFLFGVPLLIALFVTLRGHSGLASAAAATAMLGFSPMFLAHSVIAATDVCATLFITVGVIAITRYVESPTTARALTVAAAIGVAMAAKQTAVILFVVAAWAFWCAHKPAVATHSGGRLAPLAKLSLRLAAVAITAALLTWAFYGFHVTTLAGEGPWRPHFSWAKSDWFGQTITQIGRTWFFPASWVSFVVQMVHNYGGHDTYFLGEMRRFGTVIYWPVVLGVKATPPELLLLVLLLARLVATRWWGVTRLVFPAIAMLLLVVGCALGNLNLGLRYLLPAYPIALLVLFGVVAHAPNWFRRGVGVAGPLAAAAQLAIAITTSPHQLSYCNGLFVRPAAVHRVTADANLDWGHGLPSLKEAIERKQLRRVTVCTWGYLKPELHAIDCSVWWSAEPAKIMQSDWLAISAGVLHGGGPLGRALETIEPDDFAELSMMLYSMQRPEVRRAVLKALEQPR